MKIARTAGQVQKQDGYYLIPTNAVDLRLYFLTDDIIRIRAGFDGDFDEASYSLVLTAWEDRTDEFMRGYRRRIAPAEAELKDGPDAASIRGARLTVRIEKSPFRILIFDSDGTLLHADVADLAYREDSNLRRIHTQEIDDNDCFFGFGEKGGEFNKAQQFMRMSPTDAMGYDPKETDSLYKHIPFYIRLNKESRIAVGYFYHNTAECDFNMGREKSNYWHRYSSYRTDSGDIDLFFIAGPKVRDVVERYTDLTGKSALLPLSALGYLGSSMYYPELDRDSDDAILDFIDTTREEGIPADGFQLSSGYTAQETAEGLKRCVFTWNLTRFKDPERFFMEMSKRGITVSPNVKPGILLSHPLLSEMKEKGMFVLDSVSDEPAVGTWWGGPGVFVDFTKPDARREWKRLLKENVLEKGTASVWNDNCEYDSIVDKDARCDFEGRGASVGAVKSAMSNIMCHITVDAVAETMPDTRPFVICRSGHAGIQRYAETWAGDNETSWDTLKYNIATMLGMSLSGVAMQGADVCGFHGPAPGPELMVRWIQNGIFQPRFSVHSVNTDNTVTEPWMYSECTDIIRDAIRLRYRMIPYLYSLMERAHETGLPIMEPMCSAFQDDPACYDEGIDFMWGDSLLVANVVEEGQTERSVYLPKGEHFYDFYTRERYEGGQTITIPVDLRSIPLFLRAGAIIPMADKALMNLSTERVTGLSIICVPDRDAAFTLYEDDGKSMDYLDGVYLKTRIDMRCGTLTSLSFTHEGGYETSVDSIAIDMVHRERSPFTVMLDSEELPHFLHRKKYEAADTGWYYSQTLKSLQIKYRNPRKDHKLTVSFEQFDMIGM